MRRHAGLFQLPYQRLAEYVVADPADEVRLGTNSAEPGSGVRARAARSRVDGREGVGPEGHWTFDLREHVVEQVPDHDDPERRHRLRLAVERAQRHRDAGRQTGVLEDYLLVYF